MRKYFLDIETCQMLAKIWDRKPNWVRMDRVVRDWSILCWTVKDVDTGECTSRSNHQFKRRFKKNPLDDTQTVAELWKVFDSADILIAHNGDAFDIKRVKARFLAHGYSPPSPSKTVDTLKIARRNFSLTSNRLDDLGSLLGVGRKVRTEQGLWDRCEEGDVAAFEEMLRYNQQDVELLEAVYNRLRAWTSTTKHLELYIDPHARLCPVCGSDELVSHGLRFGYRRYQCKGCGAWPRERMRAEGQGLT